MKNIIISLLLFTLVTSSAVGQDLSKSLKYAYKQSAPDSLFGLLAQWNQSIQSNEAELSDDNYTKAVYSIFNEFYTPFNLKRIGSSEWGDSIYADKFAIVQNSVKYAIAEFPNPDTIIIGLKDTLTVSDSEKQYIKDDGKYLFIVDVQYPSTGDVEEEINDFRPQTTLTPDKRLFLTTDYQTELLQFLGNKHTPMGKQGIMRPARANKKTRSRQNFLNTYLNIIYGHWGGYWHLETHPEVSLIVMNPALTKAVLYFRLVYEGGEAFLEKKDGKWTLIDSKLTWIE